MSKKRGRIVFVIILLLGMVLYLFVPFSEDKKRQFTMSEEVISNPSKGFYRQISSEDPDKIARLEDDVRIVFLEYDIRDFYNKPLSKEKRSELHVFLKESEKQGKKVIFRAAYGYESEVAGKEVFDLSMVKTHMKQIAPILNQYSPVLLCVQAGFLGPWGEWHSSYLLEGKEKEEQKRIRMEVLGALDSCLNKSIVINVRRPSFLREAKEEGLPMERMGYHDDGLLASDTDLGTYKENARKEELAWCEKYIGTGINGGEVPAVSPYTQGDNVLKEFKKLKITYLNKYYNEDVLNTWKQEEIYGKNLYETVEQRLGYCFWVRQFSYKENTEKRLLLPNLLVRFSLMNSGFSMIEKGYGIRLVLEDSKGGKHYYPLKGDLEQIGSGEAKALSCRIWLKGIPYEEGYRIGIQIFDQQLDHEKYGVQLVNDDINYKEGINWIIH